MSIDVQVCTVRNLSHDRTHNFGAEHVGVARAAYLGQIPYPGGWVAIVAGASHLTPPQSGVAVRADLNQTGSRFGSRGCRWAGGWSRGGGLRVTPN